MVRVMDIPEIQIKPDGHLDDCQVRRKINHLLQEWTDDVVEIEINCLLLDHPDWQANPAVSDYIARLLEQRKIGTPEALEQSDTPKPFDWHNFAITHDALLSKDLPPIEFLVEDLITTPGTAIRGASKKRMKSWMALQLTQCIGAGSPFLGMKTKQGPVIHMALEDGERRLRQRLEMQHAAKGLPVTYITKFDPLEL
jgi:hypothetical protein